MGETLLFGVVLTFFTVRNFNKRKLLLQEEEDRKISNHRITLPDAIEMGKEELLERIKLTGVATSETHLGASLNFEVTAGFWSETITMKTPFTLKIDGKLFVAQKQIRATNLLVTKFYHEQKELGYILNLDHITTILCYLPQRSRVDPPTLLPGFKLFLHTKDLEKEMWLCDKYCHNQYEVVCHTHFLKNQRVFATRFIHFTEDIEEPLIKTTLNKIISVVFGSTNQKWIDERREKWLLRMGCK